jgi:hypothetical protein
VKNDLVNLFVKFQQGELPLSHLKCGKIILLPKKANAIQLRPLICLLNVTFKKFTKIGTNIVTDVAHNVIKTTQTAFMPGIFYECLFCIDNPQTSSEENGWS